VLLSACSELLEGNRNNLRAGDIFALGATIYELALGTTLASGGEEWQKIRDGDIAMFRYVCNRWLACAPSALTSACCLLQAILQLAAAPDRQHDAPGRAAAAARRRHPAARGGAALPLKAATCTPVHHLHAHQINYLFDHRGAAALTGGQASGQRIVVVTS
jgi:hypothetical protein